MPELVRAREGPELVRYLTDPGAHWCGEVVALHGRESLGGQMKWIRAGKLLVLRIVLETALSLTVSCE